MLKIFSLLLLIILIFVINFKNESNIDSETINNKIIYNKIITNENTNNLDKICSTINNKKYVKLNNTKSYNYTNCTLPLKIKLETNHVINLILENINKLFNYRAFLIEVVSLKLKIDNYGNKQFIINTLINNINNSAGIRLIIDVIAYIKTKHKIKNVFNKIGFPSQDQLIPIPVDVIVTERGILSTKSINEVKKDDFSYLYINSINILNSNRIIDGNNIQNKEILEQNQNMIGGINNSKLEFSLNFNKSNNELVEPAIIRNKWPKLKDEPINIKQWPCKIPPNTWNELGVPFTKINYSKECPGKRESTIQTDLQAQSYPTLGPLPRDKGINTWLFERERGITSFPTGSS